MLSKLLFLGLFLAIIPVGNTRNITAIDSRYDSESQDLLCYSRVDKSRVVRCKEGCVRKSIIVRNKINDEYSMDIHYRVGCDSPTFFPTLAGLKCQTSASNGSEYTLNYMIKGLDDRHAHIFIQKTCCFHSKCNDVVISHRRVWIKSDASMMSLLKQLHRPRSHVLPFLVGLLIFFLTTYSIVAYILKWLKTKKMSENGMNCQELEMDMILESEFREATIVDTEMEVTGRLSIKQIAHVLAKLPDADKVKCVKSKSISSEDSTKETKKMLVLLESEANINDKKVRKVILKNPLKTKAAGWGHNLWNTIRTINAPNDLLYRMIEHGPYQYPFTALELLSLFEETAFKMSDEPSLLQIDPEITIIGDIRGRYVDLHRWLQLTGWPPENRILFLGGILDSDEPGSVECLALICSLKCRFPKHVFILRGEPETSTFRMCQRLHPTITRAVQSCIKRMCSQIPFAAIIGKSILAVYSGFSPMIREKGHIHHLFRPVTSEHLNPVEKHIIFNTPSNKVRMYRPNPKGDGDFFGKQAVKRACKAMRCNVMIRGQSHVPFGYLPCWNNRLINLWSAPGYGSNYGAVLHVASDLSITPILMEKQAS